jgi:hypothetical protein
MRVRPGWIRSSHRMRTSADTVPARASFNLLEGSARVAAPAAAGLFPAGTSAIGLANTYVSANSRPRPPGRHTPHASGSPSSGQVDRPVPRGTRFQRSPGRWPTGAARVVARLEHHLGHQTTNRGRARGVLSVTSNCMSFVGLGLENRRKKIVLLPTDEQHGARGPSVSRQRAWPWSVQDRARPSRWRSPRSRRRTRTAQGNRCARSRRSR